MNAKSRLKILIDICMAVALPFLMAYSLVGEAAHEWIGMGMFVLVIAHNILNVYWYKNIFKGKYTAFRIFQMILDVSIFISMIGLAVSGFMLSRHVLAFLHINNGSSLARVLHMFSAYWSFALMMVHLGLHVNMIIGVIKNALHVSEPSKIRTIVMRIVVVILCGYGAYAFIRRQIGTYMFLQSQFVFFDFIETLIFFFVDYIVIMSLFVCTGHFFPMMLRKFSKKRL